MLFSYRGDKNSMCHFKEIVNGCNNLIFIFGSTEPPFRSNLLSGYAQIVSERTSFPGSNVYNVVAFISLRYLYPFVYSPRDLRGGYVCQHFARGDVCQLLIKILLKAGKRSFCIENTIICIKNTQNQ